MIYHSRLVKSIVAQLLSKHWGFKDLIRWLQGLQTQYTLRRDFIVDCIFEEFDVQPASDPRLLEMFGSKLAVFTAYKKTVKGSKPEVQEKARQRTKTPLFSFVPPSAGMFVWVWYLLITMMLVVFIAGVHA